MRPTTAFEIAALSSPPLGASWRLVMPVLPSRLPLDKTPRTGRRKTRRTQRAAVTHSTPIPARGRKEIVGVLATDRPHELASLPRQTADQLPQPGECRSQLRVADFDRQHRILER